MSASTAIEWTDQTWNPTTGCDRISPGCDNCYALTLAKRLKGMGQAKYQTDGDPRTSGPGFGLAVHPGALDEPLHWKNPRRVFVNSMSDLFHNDVSDDFIAQVFAVMSRCPQHTFQVLTKRTQRMAKLLADHAFTVLVDDHRGADAGDFAWPLPNVWIGTSVETQRYADMRIPHLMATPAAVRFLSIEPLLGPVNLGFLEPCDHKRRSHSDVGCWMALDWVIVGGESGPKARPMHPDWPRHLRDQCTSAEVPFFFKQWGAYRAITLDDLSGTGASPTLVSVDDRAPIASGCFHTRSQLESMITDPQFRWQCPVLKVGKKAAGRDLDGRVWDEMPGMNDGLLR